MADIKISQLELLTALDSDDIIVVNDISATSTKKSSISSILDLTSRNIYDSGSTAVIRQGLSVANELIVGGDISAVTGAVKFGSLTDITNNISVTGFVDSGTSPNALDSYSIPTINYFNGDHSTGSINVIGTVSVNGVQVLTDRISGWSAPTGTATRSTFATSTVTTEQLAQRVRALIDDLTTHGVIGS